MQERQSASVIVPKQRSPGSTYGAPLTLLSPLVGTNCLGQEYSNISSMDNLPRKTVPLLVSVAKFKRDLSHSRSVSGEPQRCLFNERRVIWCGLRVRSICMLLKRLIIPVMSRFLTRRFPPMYRLSSIGYLMRSSDST